eukprot:Seg17481.1 transcript_id=Seg17481.1/GoldUCD/mRNA.D3Y31 product="hypothetical protein" protein_id=Seg17481.1/GoldUCD/D3Y31
MLNDKAPHLLLVSSHHDARTDHLARCLSPSPYAASDHAPLALPNPEITLDGSYKKEALDLVEWNDVQAEFDPLLTAVAFGNEVSSSNKIESSYHMAGTEVATFDLDGNLDGGTEVRNDVPDHISVTETKYRYKIPHPFDGTYFAILEREEFIPDNGDSIQHIEDRVIEWNGPGLQSDPDHSSWYTSMRTITPQEGGITRVTAVAYSDTHAGPWVRY